MSSIIVCMGSGKGTWSEIYKLINNFDWENIFIITNDFFKDKITLEKKHELIFIDEGKKILEIVDEIKNKLQNKFFGDVGVNFISGSGKMHTALLSALLKLGVGLRFVHVVDNNLVEL